MTEEILTAIGDVLDGNEYVIRGIPRTPTEVVDLLFGETDNSDWLTVRGPTMFCDCSACSEDDEDPILYGEGTPILDFVEQTQQLQNALIGADIDHHIYTGEPIPTAWTASFGEELGKKFREFLRSWGLDGGRETNDQVGDPGTEGESSAEDLPHVTGDGGMPAGAGRDSDSADRSLTEGTEREKNS